MAGIKSAKKRVCSMIELAAQGTLDQTMAKPTLDTGIDHLQQDIQVKENRQLGVGAYAKVFEIKYSGTDFAGKRPHRVFQLATKEELEITKAQFLHECQIWSTLRHPNIVQFIGVHYPAGDQSGLPILVMEKMCCTLWSLVEKYNHIQCQLPLHLKLSILHDTSLGLWYLHNQHPRIVHRDLTPKNILLTSHLEAKISDYGVAKALEGSEIGRKMTQAPGNVVFMPPEALNSNPTYDTPLDVFSYGAVTLCVITQQWPEPKAKKEQFNPYTGLLELPSEAERRLEYICKMKACAGELERLVLSCLADTAAERPTIANVSKAIADLKTMANNEADGFRIDPLLLPKIKQVQVCSNHTTHA